MSFNKVKEGSDTSSASENEASNDKQKYTHLPKGNVIIQKTKTVTVQGVEHTVSTEETVNQAIIEAANITIRKAFSRKRSWDPEDIVPELMRQDPFRTMPETYVRSRALRTWKELNRKLRERQEKQSNGLFDESTVNPQLASWLGELETLQVMLDELTDILRNEQENKKRATIIKENEKKKNVVETSFLKPSFGKKSNQLSLLKTQDSRGVKRMNSEEIADLEEDRDARPHNTQGGAFAVLGNQHERRGEPTKDSKARGSKFRRDEDDVFVEDHIREKNEAIEKARFLRQQATYGDTNTDSETDSSAFGKKQRSVSETPDTDQDDFGLHLRRMQASVDKTNELTERELVLRERTLGINEANVGASGSGSGRINEANVGASGSGSGRINEANLGASGSGIGQINNANLGASHSGGAPSASSGNRMEDRLEALEGQMALLLQKMDEVIKQNPDRGAGGQ